MDRHLFTFTVGYTGERALIDKQNLKAGRNKSLDELLAEGQFKAAVCRSLYDNDVDSQKKILQYYNGKSGSHYASVEDLKRLFGVYGVPEGISKATIL